MEQKKSIEFKFNENKFCKFENDKLTLNKCKRTINIDEIVAFYKSSKVNLLTNKILFVVSIVIFIGYFYVDFLNEVLKDYLLILAVIVFSFAMVYQKRVYHVKLIISGKNSSKILIPINDNNRNDVKTFLGGISERRKYFLYNEN